MPLPIPKKHTILLVEDDRHEEELSLLALERCDLDYDVMMLRDGEEVVTYFLQYARSRHQGAWRRPDLIVMNLSLPVLDGLKVLRQLRWTFRDNQGLLPPIVLLARSRNPRLIAEAYKWGVNGLVIKPSDVADYLDVVSATVKYWLTINTGPNTMPPDEDWRVSLPTWSASQPAP